MINVVIPTYKRADVLPGKNYFKMAKYVLPESQRDDYRKTLPEKRMVVIPDKNDGNIARKRNWILNNIERPLIMIDDDVKCIVLNQNLYRGNKMVLGKKERVLLKPNDLEPLFIAGFNLATQWDCVLWGINVNTDPKAYYQTRPFGLTQMILGPFQAHREHDLFNDERMGTKDDYDFNIQVISRHKKTLRLNKYAYDCGHGDNPGGIVSQRTMELETKYCKAIMKKWGKDIIKYRLPGEKMGDLLNGIVNIPIKGV